MTHARRLATLLTMLSWVGCRETAPARPSPDGAVARRPRAPTPGRDGLSPWQPIAPSPRVRWADVGASDGAVGDRAAVRDAIGALYSAWVRRDARAYASRLAPDVTRCLRQTGRFERGAEAVVAALPREWEAFEREGAELAVRLTLRPEAIDIDGDTATARITVDFEGGTRWDFDDRWEVLQGFERVEGHWRLVSQAEGVALEAGEDPPLRFDVAYPVTDLARAVRFYRALMGEPAAVDASRATFVLGDARFILDTDPVGGVAAVRPGLPNGYVVVRTPDLDARVQDLTNQGVALATAVRVRGADRSVAALDPSGNALLFEQSSFPLLARAESSLVVAPSPGAPAGCVRQVQADVDAWRRCDDEALRARHSPDAVYFDDRSVGGAVGRAALAARLRQGWSALDRSSEGLAARFEVTSLAVRPSGAGAWVSYVVHVTGTGPHAHRETLLVTQRWRSLQGGAGAVSHTAIVRSEATGAMVLALDYTGYPMSDMAAAGRFYGRTLGFGAPYRDDHYLGYWGADAVFGVYAASQGDDGVPERGRANAYASFWVRSIDAAYARLRALGAGFPSIGAIVDHAGIDAQPGYRQVLATDSEGNALLLTEYTRE